MRCDIEVRHAAAIMGQTHKDKEDSKVHRRHDEEIRCGQLLQMTVTERKPRRLHPHAATFEARLSGAMGKNLQLQGRSGLAAGADRAQKGKE